MLGTNMIFGKVNMQFDYNLSLGELDYLGLATSDARKAGLIAADDMIRHTKYQQFVVDLGYWPTKRWNLFTKLGLNCSSSSDIDQLHNYRKTYEYTAAAQYFLDKSQEVRISLSYYGKSINYKEGINLSDSQYNCIRLALICRLNIL